MNSGQHTAPLKGPIANSMLRLAWPVLVVLALQTLVGVAETWFVSFLGTDALAGVALTYALFGGIIVTAMASGFAWGRALAPKAA